MNICFIVIDYLKIILPRYLQVKILYKYFKFNIRVGRFARFFGISHLYTINIFQNGFQIPNQHFNAVILICNMFCEILIFSS